MKIKRKQIPSNLNLWCKNERRKKENKQERNKGRRNEKKERILPYK